MFDRVARVLHVNGVTYDETIPDTTYRSRGGQIILMRSRGKNSKGAIKGKRFFAFVLSPEGKYKKMRGVKGTIRYFETPFDAAVEAATFHKQTREDWLKTVTIDSVEELALEARRLRQDIEQARRELGSVRQQLSTAQRLRLEETSEASGNGGFLPQLDAGDGIAGLPGYLRRAALLVTSRTMH